MSAIDLGIAGARDALRAKQISAAELAQAHLIAIEKHRALNAFITVMPEPRWPTPRRRMPRWQRARPAR